MNVQIAPALHFTAARRWLVAQNIKDVKVQGVGVAVPGVAIMFVSMSTDQALLLITGLVTNPLVSSTIRNKALDEVVQTVVQTAANQHLTLLAWSNLPNIISRAARFGFKIDNNYTILTKE